MSGHLVVFEFYKVKGTILLLSLGPECGRGRAYNFSTCETEETGTEVQNSLGYVVRLCLQTNAVVGMS